jgi:hypothetical protein
MESEMSLTKYAIALAVLSAAGSAHAAGPQPPVHAQHSYSFTCPSGASGHLSYSEDAGQPIQLKLWVNGQYIQADPKVAAALNGKTIDQIRGGCEGEKTTVLVQVSTGGVASSPSTWVTVLVSRTGQVTWVGV